MDFVNPSLLIGAAAIAVPIVLHLIMRQQPKLLEFPALRLVKQRQEANRRRLRWRHLLLLILRAAALCLLALALARPSIKTSGTFVDQAAPVDVALVFDTSYGMQYRDQNKSRLDLAKEMATGLLSELPKENSQAAILDARQSAAVFQVDLGAAKDRVERLEPTAVARPLVSVLQDGAALLATGKNESKEIYVFTDLARSAWPHEAVGKLQEQLQELTSLGLHVIDVGVKTPSDFALRDLRLSSQMVSKNSSARGEVDVARRGKDAERTVELWLWVEETDPRGIVTRRLERRGGQPAKLADGQTQTLEFVLRGLSLASGTNQGLVRISGEDNLLADDIRFFTIEVKPVWRVLVAAPSPAEEYAFLFTQALAPEGFRKNQQARFQTDVVTLDELAKRPLADYAAVCLLDPTPLPEGTWRRLSDYASSGGGVAIFLGPNATNIESFNQPAPQELLPGKLLMPARAVDGVFLGPNSYDHPILAKLRPLAGTIPWDGYPVYRYWLFDQPQAGVGIVVPFTDSGPAILEKPLGKGRVVTFATTVSNSPHSSTLWNQLPTGTAEIGPDFFVVLANELLLYLVGSTEGLLNYTTGDTAVLHLDAADAASTYLLTLPPKESLGARGNDTQAGEQLRRNVDTKLNAVVESSTEVPGNYRVRSGPEAGGWDRGFSVNLRPEATSLDRLPEEELKQIFGEIEYTLAHNPEELERGRNISRVGRELFPFLIVLVAVLLGLEHLMANLFYRK